MLCSLFCIYFVQIVSVTVWRFACACVHGFCIHCVLMPKLNGLIYILATFPSWYVQIYLQNIVTDECQCYIWRIYSHIRASSQLYCTAADTYGIAPHQGASSFNNQFVRKLTHACIRIHAVYDIALLACSNSISICVGHSGSIAFFFSFGQTRAHLFLSISSDSHRIEQQFWLEWHEKNCEKTEQIDHVYRSCFRHIHVLAFAPAKQLPAAQAKSNHTKRAKKRTMSPQKSIAVVTTNKYF